MKIEMSILDCNSHAVQGKAAPRQWFTPFAASLWQAFATVPVSGELAISYVKQLLFSGEGWWDANLTETDGEIAVSGEQSPAAREAELTS